MVVFYFLIACFNLGMVIGFSNSQGPPIPSEIIIDEINTCMLASEMTFIQRGPTFEESGGIRFDSKRMMTLTPPTWGPEWMWVRINKNLPSMKSGMTYTINYKLSTERPGGSTPSHTTAKLWLWKSTSEWYVRDYMWPINYSEEHPSEFHFNGPVDIEVTPTSISNEYQGTVTFTMDETQPKVSQTIWLALNISEGAGEHNDIYKVSDVCVRMHSETRQVPPSVSNFNEKFILAERERPSSEVLTTQSGCPWEEMGTVSWEAAIGSSNLGDITLPENTKVLLGSSSLANGGVGVIDRITIPPSSELIFKDETISMNVKAIVVKGKLRIGSPTCRVEGPIRITLHGTKGEADSLEGYGSKGIVAYSAGAVLDVFGRRFDPTWTRLARTARGGDERVYLQDMPLNWQVGQEVLLTTTVWDDTDIDFLNNNEVMTIKSVNPQSGVVQFTNHLEHTHYGGPEYQGEVALLSRTVEINGTPDADGFGGHVLITTGARARVAGASLRYVGQTNQLGRYPLHFHLLGSSPESYFTDNVVRDTYFRCYVVHGTHEAVVSENIAFNATGNCFYIEDGVEENNTISHNLAAYVHPIGTPAAGGAQGGAQFLQDVQAGGLRSGERVQPADATASGYYFSNTYNTIIGNVASGGWAGFSFPSLPRAIGNHRDDAFAPNSRPTLIFYGNTAHSSGSYWQTGGCIYFGGQLGYDDDNDQLLKYSSGRVSRSTRLHSDPDVADWQSTPLWQQLNNTRVHLCNRGILHWGARVEVDTIESHDVRRTATLFGEAWINNGLINGVSGNKESDWENTQHDGFQFYDVSVKSVVTNIEFRNFHKMRCYSGGFPGHAKVWQPDSHCGIDATVEGAYIHGLNNYIFSGFYHSDVYKPQQISATRNIKYTNVDPKQIIGFKIAESGASRQFNFIDHDGSATLSGWPTIVGSNLKWWQICDDCSFHADWQVWTCPKVGDREVAHITIMTPSIEVADGGMKDGFQCHDEPRNSADWSGCNVGYAAHWGRQGEDKRWLPITQNAGLSGPTGVGGWYMFLNGGSAKKLEIRTDQVPGTVLRFATPYPAGTSFTVWGINQFRTSWRVDYSQVDSITEMDESPEDSYFFDGTNFYIHIRIPDRLDQTKGAEEGHKYERGGAYVYDVVYSWIIHIEADCPTNAVGFCTEKGAEIIPSWQHVCPSVLPPPTAVPGSTLSPLNELTPTPRPELITPPPDYEQTPYDSSSSITVSVVFVFVLALLCII